MSAWKHRWGAYLDFFHRYRDVFVHYWKIRHTLPVDIFNEQEAEFLPAALSLQEKPVSKTARRTAFLLMLIVLVALTWSVLGTMDIVVNASGKIIPQGNTKTIASMEVASVRALHVKEGQAVNAGDILVELNSTAADSENDKARANNANARLQMARSIALIDSLRTMTPPLLAQLEDVPEEAIHSAQRQLASQYADYLAKMNRLQDEVKRYSQALSLAMQRAQDYKALAQTGDVSVHAWQEKEQASIELQGALNDARNQRELLFAQTKKDAYEMLNEASKVIAASDQDVRRSAEQSKLMRLISPVDGTVQQLAVHTVGGVVPAAQPLMAIVPKDSPVEVEALMENRDVGFVHVNQRANVKIDAFDYTRYGTVGATIVHVSRDAIQDEKRGLLYSVKLALDRSTMDVNGRSTALSPGMSVNVEVKTGERRIISYWLSPLIQHQRESLNER